MYKIIYANGAATEFHSDYQSAVQSLGDLMGGGERTLCWSSEAASVDDDGARAVACIFEVK